MARQDWTLNGEGACLMAWLTIMIMRSSEMGDSLAKERIDRRILMASRKGTLYADAIVAELILDLVLKGVGEGSFSIGCL